MDWNSNTPTNSSSSSSQGIGLEKACRLPNSVHSEIVPALSLPLLHVSFGSADRTVEIGDGLNSLNRPDVLMQASTIAQLLSNCDVSYLNLKDKGRNSSTEPSEHSWLYQEVLKYNPDAFKCFPHGQVNEQSNYIQIPDIKPFQQVTQNVVNVANLRREPAFNVDDSSERTSAETPQRIRKPKVRKKEAEAIPSTSDTSDQQDAIKGFNETIEEFCSRAETPEGEDEEEGARGPLLIPLYAIKDLINEIISAKTKKFLHAISLDSLNRLLTVLDRQIQFAQGLSLDANDNADTDAESLVLSALEATHAALLILTDHEMPKQIYREEMIERIIEFSRHHISNCIAAFNPQHHNINKSTENDDDEELDMEGSASKRRRTSRSTGTRKASGNRVSAAIHALVQKLCLILGFLRDLLSVIRLADSCIMQLVKTSFSTFLVDNMQLLQLKSIDLACGVFASYTQHRSFLIDETLQLLRKIQYSKKAIRTYHLPDEEQKQIQMITAILVHLVQFSAPVPDNLKSPALSWTTLIDATVDPSYPINCDKAATEASCHFWTGVLQRITNSKTQDASEAKGILENLVQDLLLTLNLPEYPASSSILEVLCVLLLANAGLKSKDISARCLAIELLGNIAARLKKDSVIGNKKKFWILQELSGSKPINPLDPKTRNLICSVCLSGRTVNITCSICSRSFHWDCMGISGQDNSLSHDWSCHLCLAKEQLGVLRNYHKLQGCNSNGMKRKGQNSKSVNSDAETVQQILLNYLREAGPQDDRNLCTRWFYLCMWYKDDPQAQEKIVYYLARLKSKEILREPGGGLNLSRDSAKKICLALNQNNSFARGFDKILTLLLVSLRENSPIIRAKALRAVSGIVEADPEVLRDKRVQLAVEGRFCDSAISVREAALELVGRHIASHPDVGLQYFEKVAERIKDMGVSVRKRAIKIVRDLFTSNPNFTGTTPAFIEIISRVNDDESSVQDLVCKTFYEIWFEEPSGSEKHYVADGSSVPMEIANKTEQIVDMLRRMPNHQPLITIVKRNLTLDFLPQSTKATGVNQAALASMRKRCELICKRLLERILQVDERASDEDEVRALPYVLALHAFCVVDPTLCVPATDQSQFVVTLQPYLKNQVDDKSIAQLLESIIFVIDTVLPLIRKPQQSLIIELEQDLRHMVTRHSFLTVVHACIKCLCSLSKTAARGANQVVYLVHVFYKHLHGPTTDNNLILGRSLFCLGLLYRYGYELMSLCENRIDIDKILGLLQKFLRMDDFSLKVRSLQALGNVLIAKPEYMLEKEIMRLLEASLSSDVHTRMKIQALENLYEYLLDAEGQLSGDGTGTKNPKTNNYVPNGTTDTSQVPVAAGAGDTNICGGIIQLYWNSVLARCLDSTDQVRQNALKIVEIVLRQGLVHPITCVPHLIALETDPLEANSKLAHHLLMNMNEKYPSFFESRLGDGLQMSFRFFETIVTNHESGNVKANPIAFVRPGVSRIYRLIRSNRNSRNKFMHSIIRKFESDNWNHSPISFLVYCTEVLASLPFTLPDEPLYLIYDINRVIQLRAGALEDSMKKWSSFAQQKLLINSDNIHEQVLKEQGAYHNNNNNNNNCSQFNQNMESTADKGFGISETGMQRLQADCHDAIALQLLLKLKRHLKIVYSLNDARCQAFSLKEAPKAGETISKQNIPLNISDIRTQLPTRLEDMVQLYQEYKTILRDDSIDYVAFTASLPKKRPTPRNPRGRKVSGFRGNDDISDDDGDASWKRGPRTLDFGSPPSGGRVTRSRFHM